MSLTDIIHRKEAELRQIKDYEVAVVYDVFGNIVVEEHGGGSSVNLGPYIEQLRSIGRATLVHNHPLGWQHPSSDPRHAGSSFRESREEAEANFWHQVWLRVAADLSLEYERFVDE